MRADYLGGRYWSEVFNATDAAVDIAHGRAAVHIAETGSDIYDAPVYLFTETGSYLGRMQRTDSAGMARFLIPAGAYKFRVDCNGTQCWSDAVHVLPDEETAVDLALDLLAMDLTNDPDPVRLDGKPPKLEKESVLLASLFDITGLLVRKVFADTGDDDAVFYYINDHLGTPRIIIDETGNIVWKGDYQPFGSVDAVVSDLGNNFRFAGQYYDSETGLHYNYHRYYDPVTGRYLRSDPIGLVGGINLYAYVQNNPIIFIDPYGLSWSDILPGIGTAILQGFQGGAYAVGQAANATADIAMNGPPLAQAALGIAFFSEAAPLAGAAATTAFPYIMTAAGTEVGQIAIDFTNKALWDIYGTGQPGYFYLGSKIWEFFNDLFPQHDPCK